MTLDLTRRSFLKLSTALTVTPLVARPAWMPRLAFAPEGVEPQGDLLVCVFQRGGMDGLSAMIPQGASEYFQRRPTLAIAEAQSGNDQTALDLDGFFGLHPALRPLKDLWDARALAMIHATGSPDPTHSHFDAMDYMERGTPGEKQMPTGWIGRHLQTAPWQNDSPFRAVGLGTIMQAALRGPVPVTTLRSIADFHLQGRLDELANIQQTLSSLYDLGPTLGEEASVTFEAVDRLATLPGSAYQPENGAQYPESEYGLALQQVAQLAKADLGLEVACVDIGGWDTHVGQGALDGELPGLLAEFGQGLAALYHDLGERVKRTTIVTMSEFGRRVYENGGEGTDHGHGNVMFVMGGGINGGKVYGQWPGLAPEQLAGPGDLQVTTDYRTVLAEIVTRRLANPGVADIFPEFDTSQALGVAK